MQDIRLMNLSIRNFKGIKELDIELDGKNADIVGRNATGKTSIKDAFSWLLFDKDSSGKTKFGIKPTDKNGDLIHNLETSVEATFEINGDVKQFRKTMQEVWTRKRGAAEPTFTRNENGYFVNTVPKKKAEYTSEISKLISEDVFKAITDLFHFNKMKWQDRRAMLIDMCGNVSDLDVIHSSSELAPLEKELKGRTVDELNSIITRSMKATNKELESIPTKIQEAELAKPFIDDDIELEKKEKIEEEINQLLKAKNDITNGTAMVKMKSEIKTLDNQMLSVGKDFNAYETPEYAKVRQLKDELHDSEKTLEKCKTELSNIAERLKDFPSKKKELSELWDEAFTVVFTGSVCPTCGQELPPEQVEEKKKSFNIKKAKKLDDIEEKLKSVKKNETDLMMKKSDKENELAKAVDKINDINLKAEEAIRDYQKMMMKYSEDVEAKKTEIRKKIDEIKQSIADYEVNSKDELNAIEARLRVLEGQKSDIDTVIASYELVKKQEERIKFLESEQARLSKEYTDLERTKFLIERFTVKKVSMLTDKINSNFRLTKFKLFNQNINGGIEETCIATQDGIDYEDLNDAMTYNVGLDIINTLCNYYGTRAPIFVDRAGEVLEMIPTDSQIIRLVVADQDLHINIKEEI